LGGCGSCGGDNPAQAAFCRHCGAALNPGGAVATATAPRRARWWLYAIIAVALAAAAVAAFLMLRSEPATTPVAAPLEWKTIGKSVEDRPIESTSFGTGAARRVLVLGGVHGGEYGARTAARFARYLHANPEAVPPEATIDVVRCLNPDGAARGARGNARNVDLNRNMPTANWRRELSKGDQSRSKFHLSGGASPGSEPETKALLRQLGRGYDVVLSLHSHGGILDPSGPGGSSLAKRMSAACGLKVDKVTYDAAITGSMGQYIPEKFGIPVVTVELDSPVLSPALIDALLVAAR
jgi:murein peptide amidase A